MPSFRTLLVLVSVAGVAASAGAAAQGVFSGGTGDRASRRNGYTPPPLDRTPAPPRDNAPRLEAGALLCPTEQALQQYQASVLARAEGRDGPAVRGCRLVQRSTAVTVVERRSGRVHVRLAAPASPDDGWTDAALPG